MIYIELALRTHLDASRIHHASCWIEREREREKVMDMLQAFQDDYFQDNSLQVVYQVIYFIIILLIVIYPSHLRTLFFSSTGRLIIH